MEDLVEETYQQVQQAAAMGIVHLVADDEVLDGRSFAVGGRRYVNFNSCSYLGLEVDARLKAGAIAAVERYGVQMSNARTYVSAPPYARVEALATQMFGGHVIITPSTTLAHLSALPVLVRRGDVVLFDAQVHHSVQAVLPSLVALGASVERVSHLRVDHLDAKVRELSPSAPRVHFLTDGVFSIRGDTVDMAAMRRLVDAHPKLHLYIDDAHGVSWYGPHGRGHALADGPIPRTTVVGSAAKSFGAGGGIIVCHDEETWRRVRSVGPSLIFSGPMQIPVLGALEASFRLHLSDELPALQAELMTRVEHFDRAAEAAGLDFTRHGTPIRFLEIGDETRMQRVVQRVAHDGYFTTLVMYPGVRRGGAGLRLALNRSLRIEDIDGLIESVARALRDIAVEAPTVAATG